MAQRSFQNIMIAHTVCSDVARVNGFFRFWPVAELAEYLEIPIPELLKSLDLIRDMWRVRSAFVVRPQAAMRLIYEQTQEGCHDPRDHIHALAEGGEYG